MAEQPRKRRVPLGRPLSADELEALAEITAEDVQRAGDLWRDGAPRPLKRLLDATPEVDDAT